MSLARISRRRSASAYRFRCCYVIAGWYFQRQGQFITAYHCFSLLDQVVPGSLGEFLDALPLAEIGRFSPAIVPRVFMVPGKYFFAFHRIKRSIVDSLGEPATALLLGQFLGQRDPWHATRRTLTSLQDYVLTNDLPYEEIIAPRPVAMSEPEFFGEDSGPPIHGTSRSVFFSVLPDVIVSSKSNLFVIDESVLMDYQADELERYPVWFDLDPVVLAADGTSLTVLEHDDSGRQPPLEEALSLVGMYTYNYAHWIVEKLFKVLVCLDRPGFRNVPIIVDEQMQPAHLEMLRGVLRGGTPSRHPPSRREREGEAAMDCVERDLLAGLRAAGHTDRAAGRHIGARRVAAACRTGTSSFRCG